MKNSTKKFSFKFKNAADIQRLLLSNGMNVMCMKMYSQDTDIDIVVMNPRQYNKVKDILQKNGWLIHNNISKIRERDKDFFIQTGQKFLVHLHKYFSWNTVPYLDASLLWKRKRTKENVFLPSFEDELLIIAAHSLFENMCITPEELRYGKQIMRLARDKDYMPNHAYQLHWEHGFEIILGKLLKSESLLTASELLTVRLDKLSKDIAKGRLAQLFNEILAYVVIDWIWCYPKRYQKPYGLP